MIDNLESVAETAEEYTKRTLLEVTAKKFSEEVAELVKGIPETERESWSKQEYEAKNVLADPSFQAPYLEQLALSRGLNESKVELAGKVMNNVAVYELAHAKLLGEYQKKIKVIESEYP